MHILLKYMFSRFAFFLIEKMIIQSNDDGYTQYIIHSTETHVSLTDGPDGGQVEVPGGGVQVGEPGQALPLLLLLFLLADFPEFLQVLVPLHFLPPVQISPVTSGFWNVF